jgi:hypothetical protein
MVRGTRLNLATLVLLALLTLAGGLALPGAPARAEDVDECDPTEAVACIAVVEEGMAEVPEADVVEVPEAGAVSRPAIPPPPPTCPPIVLTPELDRIARPVPVPPGCPARAVLAAVNRANALYVRAVRTLDTRELGGAWGGEALRDVQTQVANLRASGRYATPQLLAIHPVEVNARSTAARVRTYEHWIYQERYAFSGEVALEEDLWAENIYDLTWRTGLWIIVRDVITRMDAPAPPPPPPAPGPGIMARITTDREHYFTGDPVEGTIYNDGSSAIVPSGSYLCSPFILERLGPLGWEPVPGPPVACPAIAIVIRPGGSVTHRIAAGPGFGTFRLASRLIAEGSGATETVYSAAYVVE